jgi:hypothetical protein
LNKTDLARIDKVIHIQEYKLGAMPEEKVNIIITSSGDFGLFGQSESLLNASGNYHAAKKKVAVKLVKLRKKKLTWKFVRPSRARCLLNAFYKSKGHKFRCISDITHWLFWLRISRKKIKCDNWEIASMLRVLCEMYGYNLVCVNKSCTNMRIKGQRVVKSKIKHIIPVECCGIVYSGKTLESQGFYCRQF